MFYPGKKLSNNDIKELTKQAALLCYGDSNLNKLQAVDLVNYFEKSNNYSDRYYKQRGVFGAYSECIRYYSTIKVSLNMLPNIMKFIHNKVNNGCFYDGERVGKLPDLSLNESFVIDVWDKGITSPAERDKLIEKGYGSSSIRLLYKNQNDIELSYSKKYTVRAFRSKEDFEKIFKFFKVKDKEAKQAIIEKMKNAKDIFICD